MEEKQIVNGKIKNMKDESGKEFFWNLDFYRFLWIFSLKLFHWKIVRITIEITCNGFFEVSCTYVSSTLIAEFHEMLKGSWSIA